MSDPTYTAPEPNASAFNCPICGAYAHFAWERLNTIGNFGEAHPLAFYGAHCRRCGGWTVWSTRTLDDYSVVPKAMVYPRVAGGPRASPDMPSECRRDYDEARAVFAESPRAAAALLRLCIERLCRHLDAEGKTLDQMIGDLVKKGLSPRVQKMLDTVRVIGNNAVHPGQMAMDDDARTAEALFRLVNAIVESQITEPRQLDEIYGSLPEGARLAIAKRDGGRD